MLTGDQLDYLFPLLLTVLETGGVQVQPAELLQPPDYSQLEVYFPCVPDPPTGCPGRHQLVVELFYKMILVVGFVSFFFGDIWVFAFTLFLHVRDYAAKEFCTQRGG